jgi:hypothetical protein
VQTVAFGVQEALEVGHAVGDGCVRRWHEDRVARTRPTYPVLAASKLARLLPAPSASSEELPVNLADQSSAERETATQAGKPVLHRGHVVRHLHDVVDGHAWGLLHFEEQQVGERGLRPLDLRREHGLLADIGVEKEPGVRQEGGDAVEPSEGEQRPFQKRLDLALECQSRLGR